MTISCRADRGGAAGVSADHCVMMARLTRVRPPVHRGAFVDPQMAPYPNCRAKGVYVCLVWLEN